MTFRSSGKLLITGEYLVLKGAKALALPTKFGQEMEVTYSKSTKTPTLFWTAYNSDNQIWLTSQFELPSLKLISSSDEKSSKDLQTLLSICFTTNNSIFKEGQNINITTHLEFPNNWGLGSSSTLISNLSKWSKVDAFKLLRGISKGSGFDVAVALENKAIIYQLIENNPTWNVVNFNPNFSDNIYFIHLNQKQKSEHEIKKYQENSINEIKNTETTSAYTSKLLNAPKVSDFESIIHSHETLISKEIMVNKISDNLFTDYTNGVIKSLGAWGGDFILVTIKSKSDLQYFKDKGYNTILSYNEMILQ